MGRWHLMTVLCQRADDHLVHRFKLASTCDRAGKVNIHFPGSRERMEFFGRFWEGGFKSIPERILSSSVLNCIQFSTRITRCGVLSLKKNLYRNSRSNAGEIGYPLNSITS